MKKLFVSILSAALMLAATNLNAQVVVGAGYLLSLEKTVNSGNGSPADNAVLNGGFFGASYNFRIVAGLGVAPGLYGTLLAFNDTSEAGGGGAIISLTGRYREFALNVPLNITYNFDISDRISLFAFAGPVFQCGIVSKTTVTAGANISIFGKKFNIAEDEKYNHYDPEKGDRNRFNLYLGGGVGAQFGDIQVLLGYDASLLDVDRYDGFRTSRNQIKIGINFSF